MIRWIKSKKARNIFLAFLFIVGVCLLYAYYEARNIHLRNYVFSHKDIPQSFDGKTIAFLTDIHTDSDFDRGDLRALVDSVNKLYPDIILMGGDYVSGAKYIDTFLDEISKLKAKDGIYAVLGNHDHWSEADKIARGLKKSGIRMMDNQSCWVRSGTDSIKIGGVGDWWCDETRIESTVDDISEKDFCILLSHQPNFVDELKSNKIDLILSGHTHAGQITLFGFWAPVMPGQFSQNLITSKHEYRYGWMNKKDTQLYVSSGIGMGGVPFRFFAHPEVVLIRLKKL